ncbi:hypothetical protein PZ739_10240 [Pseudomonas kermanshahensis]|uniref:DUF6957 family protein n=1 Tax=Pseudomonas kermanshahensis TaxID=2745482 RepID=UPI0023DAC27E|nr:hypothetical protein [Pseudomonas kermanshahensis]WEL57507.1 hypothetical protein PZ739_10240 [Pseudomonas kermanshahensis]
MPISIEDAFQFLYGEGEKVEGWSSDPEELVRLAQDASPGKPYCLVKSWVVAEISGSEDELTALVSDGLLTKVIFAHEVVRDSRNRFPPGHWVRSNFGISYDHPCVFETGSTLYLLLGDGCRKQASLDTVFSLRP